MNSHQHRCTPYPHGRLKHYKGFEIHLDHDAPAIATWWWCPSSGTGEDCMGYGMTAEACRDEIDDYLAERALLAETASLRKEAI